MPSQPSLDPQIGAIELVVHWTPEHDSTLGPVRNPTMEVIATPLDINDGNALYVRGSCIEIQVKNKYVQDKDLKFAMLGPCTGYLTVYPGYLEKKMEPPVQFAITYTIDWCSWYPVDAERSTFKIYARAMVPKGLREDIDFFWGRFG